MSDRPLPDRNAIDALRLTLAMLLVVTHGLARFHGVPGPQMNAVNVVPVFFFLSGFYVVASYKRRPDPAAFLKRRYLRLLPIPLISALLTLGLLVASEGTGFVLEHSGAVLGWLLAVLTLYQTYWPGSFADIGLDLQNNGLWFIAALLAYYLCVPVLDALERRGLPALLVLTLASALLFTLFQPIDTVRQVAAQLDDAGLGRATQTGAFARYLFMLATSFWMFGLGALARQHWAVLSRPAVIVAIIGASAVVTGVIEWSGLWPMAQTRLSSIWYVPGYVAAWMALAIWLPKLPRLPDISVCIFVAHTPLFIAARALGLDSLAAAIVFVVPAAVMLHVLIERPMHRILGVGPSGEAPQVMPVRGSN